MESASINNIRVYPIKSLDPIEMDKAEVGTHSLKDDRNYAIIDTQRHRYMNGKRTGRVNQLQTTYDLENHMVTFAERYTNQFSTFELRENNPELNQYLSDFFDENVTLEKDTTGKFMDIPVASSITIVSTASLESLRKDLPEKTLDDMRLRFRSNIELSAPSPYWEENMFADRKHGKEVLIGEVNAIGVSPRMRCNVPPKNPLTGQTDKTFVKRMMQSRQGTLPENSKIPDFGSLYHLTMNVYLPKSEIGKFINLGDEITIGAVRALS